MKCSNSWVIHVPIHVPIHGHNRSFPSTYWHILKILIDILSESYKYEAKSKQQRKKSFRKGIHFIIVLWKKEVLISPLWEYSLKVLWDENILIYWGSLQPIRQSFWNFCGPKNHLEKLFKIQGIRFHCQRCTIGRSTTRLGKVDVSKQSITIFYWRNST